MTDYYWTAVYTRSRAEKKIAQRLEEMNVEYYLPIQKTKVKWSDRWKLVEKVMIPGYIFVYISEREYYNILNIVGCVAYVRQEGKAARIRESQINSMKLILQDHPETTVIDNSFGIGQQVQICHGPFAGFVGEVQYLKNTSRLIVRIDQIGLCVSLEVPMAHVQEPQV